MQISNINKSWDIISANLKATQLKRRFSRETLVFPARVSKTMGVEDGATTMEDKVKTETKKGLFSVNKNLIMLKLTLFFLYGGQ